jgi:CBS domain-containing protein
MPVNPSLHTRLTGEQLSMLASSNAGGYMTRDIIVVTPDVTVRGLEALFATHDINAFPVVERDPAAGIVTKFDLDAVPTGVEGDILS